MPDRIFLPPGVSSASVVLIGGQCYQRVGASEQWPTVSSVDEEYDSCDDCEGSSSSSTSYSSDPCSDCQPVVEVQGAASITIPSTSCISSTLTQGSVEWQGYQPGCSWFWSTTDGLYTRQAAVAFNTDTGKWTAYCNSQWASGLNMIIWGSTDLPASTFQCDPDSGVLSGSASLPWSSSYNCDPDAGNATLSL